jgi:hypothetical protein
VPHRHPSRDIPASAIHQREKGKEKYKKQKIKNKIMTEKQKYN